jgi:undecaprenyl diphosphate synthase
MKHLGIIMDGNRRWAKKNGKSIYEGHKVGLDKLIEVVDMCRNKKIEFLTIFAFSNENWNRTDEEVKDLMELIDFFLEKNTNNYKKNNIKVKIIGRRDNRLSENILKKIENIENITSDCNGFQLNIAFNYGGRQEIIDVVKKIVKSNIDYNDIDEKIFANNLYYGNIPEPDMIIRTSGEQRISNFLLWEMAYSEFYFTDSYWPEFNENLLDKILENFNRRERRHGR